MDSDQVLLAGVVQDAKKAGKVRQEGKTYIVQDGDIISFLFKIPPNYCRVPETLKDTSLPIFTRTVFAGLAF
jgi:hypothetical protein